MTTKEEEEEEDLGFSIEVNNSTISITQEGPSIPGVEADGDAAGTGLRVEGVDGLKTVFVEDVSDLKLVLFPTTKRRSEHRRRSLPLPEQVDL